MVLIGTKADADKKKRKVTSFEGQSLARRLNCPFVEVSSKTNDRVHEVSLGSTKFVTVASLAGEQYFRKVSTPASACGLMELAVDEMLWNANIQQLIKYYFCFTLKILLQKPSHKSRKLSFGHKDPENLKRKCLKTIFDMDVKLVT